MTHSFGEGRIALVRADITSIEADAIVNAANAALAGGGGVDGAIHRAGGPDIMAECRRIGGCPTGGAVVTGAGRLPARFVIHAVAPVYRGAAADPHLLRSAYATALALGRERGLAHLAFPSLGTGAYGYPIAEAAAIALETVSAHLLEPTSLRLATFALFSDRDLGVYAAALERLAKVK